MIRVGIIGCGKISELRHAPEYSENDGCTIAAYYDFDKTRAEALASRHGGVVCDSIDDLLATDIDAVSVCVANTAHAETAIQALDAGKHVLCEKPMAVTLAECEAMIDAARRSGKWLMIGHNQRFAKAHVKARELVERGEIGRVISFETHFGHPGPEGWTGLRDSWFFDRSKAAFGAMADLGVHKTDLIHFLLGSPIVAVSAVTATLDKTHADGRPVSVDDNAFCIYETRSGAVGTMHVSWTFYGEERNHTILYGTAGVLRCYDDPACSLILERRSGKTQRFDLDQLTSNKDQNEGGRTSTGVIDAFIAAIAAGTPPPVTGEDAVRAMRVIFAAEESAQSGRRIAVDQGENR